VEGPENPYEQHILPWLAQADVQRDWIMAFGNRTDHPYPHAEIEDLWQLYALSRVNDVCLIRFQPQAEDPAKRSTTWDGLDITLAQYVDTFLHLGLEVVSHASFHPFFHEIVGVQQADSADEPIQVVDVIWPCFMLGDMLFSRAGVVVRGGRDHIRRDIAVNATIYWTYWRKNRPTNDLSHGWGSNSQWRTSFRRDYRIDGRYLYNVDNKASMDKVNLCNPNVVFDPERVGNATVAQRIELLRNRCFIKTDLRPDNDFWPYDDYFEELISLA
jgi:hypothetical protein